MALVIRKAARRIITSDIRAATTQPVRIILLQMCMSKNILPPTFGLYELCINVSRELISKIFQVINLSRGIILVILSQELFTVAIYRPLC